MDIDGFNNYCTLLPEGLPNLYKRISSEIIKFLNDNEHKILYLQWPTEELTNKTNKKGTLWQEICDVISYAIRVCLKPQYEYNKAKNYFIRCGEEEYYIKKDENSNRVIAPFYNCPYRKKLNFTGKNKESLLNSAIQDKNFYEIEIPNDNKKNLSKKVKEEVCVLSSNKYFQNENLQTAAIYCSPYYDFKLAGQYVYPKVETFNSNGDFVKKDVIAIIGDKVFDKIQRIVNINPKKLIVFGTSHHNYLMNQNPYVVTFTLKEAYEYCNTKNNYKYVEPQFIAIKFDWLSNKIKELNDCLRLLQQEDNGLIDEDIRFILNLFRYPLTSINFTRNDLEEYKKSLIDYIDERLYNIREDTFDKIVEWIECISYEEYNNTNPKKKYLESQNNCIFIDINRSIQRQLNDDINDKFNGKLVMDLPKYSRDVPIEFPICNIMRYRLYAQVIVLYYEDIQDDNMRYVKNSLNNNPYFPNHNAEQESTNMNGAYRLEDYMYDYIEYLNESNSSQFETIYFVNDTFAQITGDVLLHKDNGEYQYINAKDINQYSGRTITYYVKHDCFDDLMRGFLGLPKDRGIDYYVTQWHNALQQYISIEGSENFCREFGISQQILNNHLNGTSNFLTKRKFEKVLRFLKERGYLDEEEMKFVLAARNMQGVENIKFGKKLKESLFEHIINPESNKYETFFNKILSEESTKESLCEKFLSTNIIR